MYKALIVDDEKPVRIAVSKLANWEKYNITEFQEASNGKEALNSLSGFMPDIVFLDICMPVMNGLDFLKEAKQQFPNMQFIIVSGYDDFSYAQTALRYGATDYLLKPIDDEMLNNAIEHAISKISKLTLSPLSNITEDANDELSPDKVIELIKTYIDTNYSENIRITMFADKYFFSKEYLSRQFKTKYGHSIYEYVLITRMEKAKALLLDPAMKIQQVGEKVGFSDNNYFSKAFRNFYGVSPSEFRAK